MRISYAQALRSYPRIAALSKARYALLDQRPLFTILRFPNDAIATIDQKLLVRLVTKYGLKGSDYVGPGHSVPISHAYESPFGHAHVPRQRITFRR
jgi:hypothetical protein